MLRAKYRPEYLAERLTYQADILNDYGSAYRNSRIDITNPLLAKFVDGRWCDSPRQRQGAVAVLSRIAELLRGDAVRPNPTDQRVITIACYTVEEWRAKEGGSCQTG